MQEQAAGLLGSLVWRNEAMLDQLDAHGGFDILCNVVKTIESGAALFRVLTVLGLSATTPARCQRLAQRGVVPSLVAICGHSSVSEVEDF